MNIRFYRYGVSGSLNVLFGWVLYFVVYNFILHHQQLHVGHLTLSSHIASLVLTSPITLLSGFFLQKYVTFTSSDLRGKIQLFRYLMVYLANLTINTIGLKILVDMYGLNAEPSEMIMTVICIIFSYISQKTFTFKTSSNKI
jgi:putative flippase GtrA